MRRYVVIMAMVLGALCGGCKRTLKVTTCRDAKVLDSLNAGANIIATPTVGEVFDADKPPKEPPVYWWLHTKNGVGMVGGNAATPYPAKGDPYTVTAPSTDEYTNVNAKTPTRTHFKGTRLSLSFVPPCNVPDGWIAVIEDGRPVGFVQLNSVTPGSL